MFLKVKHLKDILNNNASYYVVDLEFLFIN